MNRVPLTAIRRGLGLVVLGWLLASCAPFYRGQANKSNTVAYRIIEDKQTRAFGEAQPFSIDQGHDEATSAVLQNAGRLSWDIDVYTTPSYTLLLADSLAIAFANSRDYQTRKEDLFLSALSLSTTRYDYGFIFNAGGDVGLTRVDSGDRTQPNDGIEKFGSGSFTAGVQKQLATGAEISVSFTKNFIRYFTGDPRESSDNRLSLNVVQPLLNGAGPLVAREGLRQAERDMIYAVRTFRRYQQSFVIDIASSYYDLLQRLDLLRNEYVNYRNALLDLDKAVMNTQAGNISQLEQDQTRQRTLEAENRLNLANASYLSALDRFKLTLGLPLDLDIGPDPRELDNLKVAGMVRPDLDLSEAISIALKDRLDLMTAEDRTSDSVRKVKIAANNFLPTLDARYDMNTANTVDNDKEFRLDFEQNRHTLGFDLELPLDWTPRRNRYRQALIASDRARRDLGETRDSIILEVREAWRDLERSRKSYEIQQLSLDLAERRVESAQLLLDSGKATTRDLLEAQDSLLQSQNALTESLVNYTLQRLDFWNSIERLKIDPKGMWYENTQ